MRGLTRFVLMIDCPVLNSLPEITPVVGGTIKKLVVPSRRQPKFSYENV